MNVCLCGAQAGYPHRKDCPRPLFRANETEAEKWEVEREELRAARAAGIHDPDRWGRMKYRYEPSGKVRR